MASSTKLNTKLIQLMANKWQLAVLVTILIIIALLGIACLEQSVSSDRVDLRRIIDLPKEFKSEQQCPPGLSDYSEVTDVVDWPLLGILPEESQIKQEVIFSDCVRAAIAIYADRQAASKVFQSVRDANMTVESASIAYSSAEKELTMITTPWIIQAPIPWSLIGETQDWNLENRIVIMKECNTVVTLFIFVRDENEDFNTTFGLSTNDAQILSYAKQIYQRIETDICPLITELD